MDPFKQGGEEWPTAPHGSDSPPEQWLIGDWLADSRLDELRRGDQVEKIEPRNMRLLAALAQRPGEVLTVDELLTEVWADLVVTQSSVYQAVSQLRQVLGDDASRPRYIATVPRKGYRLVAVVQPVRVTRAPVPAEPVLATVPLPGPVPVLVPLPAPVVEEPALAAPAATSPVASPQPPGRAALGRRGWMLGGGAAALALAGGGAFWWQRAGRLPPDQVRLAVLPFQDTSAHKLEQPLAEGLAEQVIGALTRHGQVRVLSRATSFQFSAADALLPLAEQHIVTHVLGGELTRSAQRVSLNLHLQALPRQRVVWREALEVEVAELSRLALNVANQALQALGAAPVAAVPTVAAPDAYELYLTGLQHQRSAQLPGILKAREYFQRAIDRDAGFAPAYVGQAATWIAEFHYGSGLTLRDMDARAQPLIDRALQLAPELPLAQGLQGHLKANLSLHDEARRWLAPALQHAPSDVTLLTWSAKNEMDDGHPGAAGPLLQRAAELSPLAVQVQHLAGLAATYAGRYDTAQAHYRRAMVLAPQHANGAWGLGLVGYARGQLAEAVQGYRKALVVDPRRDALWTQLGWLYLDLGMPDEARHAFAQAASMAAQPAEAQLGAARLQLGDEAALRRTLTGLKLPASGARDLELDTALLWLRLGDLPRARRVAEPAIGLMLADPLPAWGNWDAFQGRHALIDAAAVWVALGEPARAEPLLAQAEAFLQRYREQGNAWHAGAYLQARVEALRGRTQAAVTALEAAVAQGWRRSWWIPHDPALATVRELPRVVALQAQVRQKAEADRRTLA